MKQSLKSLLYGSYLVGTALIFVHSGRAQSAVSATGVPAANNFAATGNPIIKNKYTADPAAFVHNNTVYLNTGHDEAPPRQERYVMNEWLLFSSTDMKTWTEHPSPLNVKEFKWAKGDAWASQ